MPTGQYMTQTYGSFCYAKAQNLRPRLCAAYDAILSEYDLLLMPTLPMTTPQLPVACVPVDEIIARALEMVPSTSAFDLAAHAYEQAQNI